MPSIPISSPFGYLGVFLSILGFFLIVAGVGILNVEKISVKPGRTTWGMGIVLAIIGLGLLYFEMVGPNGLQATPTPVPPTPIILPSAMPFTPGMVISDNVLLYEQQDEKSKVTDTLPLGTNVDVLQIQGKWLFITYDRNNVHYQGWALKQDIKINGQ